MGRLILVGAILFVAIFSLIWTIVDGGIFENKRRLRKILKIGSISVITIIAAGMVMAFLASVDHIF